MSRRGWRDEAADAAYDAWRFGGRDYDEAYSRAADAHYDGGDREDMESAAYGPTRLEPDEEEPS